MADVMHISFNPTAVALQATSDNAPALIVELIRLTGKPFTGLVTPGMYYVTFLGQLYVMTEKQFRAAQGYV